MSKKQILLKNIKQALETELADSLCYVILFGSRAWGKARRDSDYDLLIVVREPDTWQMRDRISACLYDIDLAFGICTQPLVISKHALEDTLRGKQPIFQKALEKGIYL